METKDTNPKDLVGSKKVSFSHVPQTVMMEVAVGMTEGMSKYGRHNYRVKGVRASVYYDATRRHLDAWWEGQDMDPGSGLNHVTKALTSLVVLRDAMLQGSFTDDRPPQTLDVHKFMEDLNQATAEIIEKYKHLNPKHYTKDDHEDSI